MPTAEHWEAFAGVAAVVVFLGGLVMALKRLGLLPAKEAAKTTPSDCQDAGLIARIEHLEHEVQEMRLALAETYVRRDDWVPMTSRVLHMLEEHSVMLARLDTRSRLNGDSHAE